MSPFLVFAAVMILTNLVLATWLMRNRRRARRLHLEIAAAHSHGASPAGSAQSSGRGRSSGGIHPWCERLIGRYAGDGVPFSVVLIQVAPDLNDAEGGHELWTSAEARVAEEAIVTVCGAEDAAFSYDDGTFVVLLADAVAADAAVFIERTRLSLGRLSLSAGAVEWREGMEDIDAALHEARKQLDFVRRSIVKRETAPRAGYRAAA